ncbi:hypothetical protein BCON_0067g00210 [Botryotinia convoluta]|uniref:Uncharacterized protein n=1 Tax=Botryotinia convoluta TaxID=54673 RepID=A0A4Z1IE42_9HELO|nr:hypothetical protein BCON_0067g00210 [Botryotinia convoluta]
MTYAKRHKNDDVLEYSMGSTRVQWIKMVNFEIKPSKANFYPVRMKYPCTDWVLVLDSESEELPLVKGETGGDNWGSEFEHVGTRWEDDKS